MASNQLHRAVAAALTLTTAPLALAGTIEFSPAPFPLTDVEKRSILTSDSATVDGVQVQVGYNTILRSGDTAGGGTFGLLHDIDGNALVAEDGSPYISNDNDFASILNGEDGKLYMVSHFESRPGAMYLTELSQNPQTGVLSALRTRALDFSAVRGGWVHCAGSVTPWGTHLGSEEYEPDAKQWRDNNISDYNAAMATYFGATPEQASSVMNPYDYGYPVEVKVNNYNDATVAKHYAMGRMALELGYVMPDNKTVYMSDDGTNVGLFRFVADTAGNLDSGSLWVARWSQKTGGSAGAANLDWVYLGHATSDQVSQWKDSYKFADIFDEADPIMENDEDTGACPAGYTSINAGHEDGDHQCLRLRDIDGDGFIWASDWNIASRLETRRWAAMSGGTTEFRKMEGITYNSDADVLYIAMSETDRGMLDFNRAGKTPPYDKYDIGGPNHMTIAKGNACGTVYALSLDGNYTAAQMWPLVSGTPMTTDYGADADSPNYDGVNKCDINGLANPDNITYMPGYNTLIIGEDTGSGHQNDMIWAYNIQSGSLTRIQTTPYGSETTSPYFYPNINGFAYLMSVVQHPYGESDEDKLEQPSEASAYTGHMVFPAMTK
ncbi:MULTISPECIES: PhoX family protein [Thiorhodovibrio]|uniref:PhoX family protein n=1 Tax=Thiorhodovibrio TaxID=61593 RepID=UPI00191363B7|nr:MULTISPECIES: alkaline phosphatase PhoX [Thiorhodovibrio]MBK5970372.1 phosphatase [Thiorhodovibrio winogradskyi]WPL14324.1 putative phosphatase [Thiorhodovibrio litoralis]